MLLLQQPEVHLHPRAQAALGSFFVQLVATQKKKFVIETHSDFLVDRIRREVAKGVLSSDAVRILFFERRHGVTKIYSIAIDGYGNLRGAPSTYRQFFLEEEDALLERTAR
jgi:predicted ATPase